MSTMPEFALPVQDADPKRTTKEALDTAINSQVIAPLWDRIDGLSNGVTYIGEWDASSGAFPAGTSVGDVYRVSVAGTVGGEAFTVNDRLISLVDGASTSVFAGNWDHADSNSDIAPVEADVAALQSANPTVLLENGAVGDGVANDAAIIDTYNVANTTVDLGGRTYFYDGEFEPAAVFRNGIIDSSASGIFDKTTAILTTAKTVTVGPSGTLKTLRAAKLWLQDMQWLDLTLSVSGDHDLTDVRWDHIDTPRLKIVGATAPTMPTAADMVGSRATDEALIISRFGARIEVGGSGDSTSGGLTFPNGIGLIQNVCITGNTRYMLSAGFNDSHFVSTPAGILRMANVAIIGGVWGVLAVSAQVRIKAGTRCFFAYQNTGSQPGGPMDLINSHARFEGFYEAYSAGQASKYGLFVESKSVVKADQRIIITGPFLHGVMCRDLSVVDCDTMTTTGVSQPITCMSGSSVSGINCVFSDGDVANTATMSNAPQEGWGNNNAASAMVFAGAGATVAINNCTFTNMVGSYCFHSIGGIIYHGVTAATVDDCRFALAFARFFGSGPNYIAFNITNPKAGSLDQCLALAISTVRIGTNSGASFNPAVNTPSNGNLFATTG